MLGRKTGGFWKRGNAHVAARSLASIVTLFSFVAGLVPCAFAQGAQDTAAAEVLFDEARKLLVAGNTDAACPKLEESQRLAPAVGTLLNLGICYETAHRNASAWATFKEAISAARQAGQSDRERLATARAKALEGKFATLTIRVPAGVANVPGLEVKRDGDVVAAAGWGSALPLDAGAHAISVSAPNHETWTRTVTIGEGADSASIEVPVLAKVAPVTKTNESASTLATSEPAKAKEDEPSGLQKTVGVLVGAAGLAGIATGGVLGVVAKNKNEEALANHCNYTNVCDSQGIALTNEARSTAVASTIAVGAGGAAIITGLVLFLTAPKKKEKRAGAAIQASPTFDIHGGGLRFGGVW